MRVENEWKGEELISNLATLVLFGGLIFCFITMILESSKIVTFPLTPISMVFIFVLLGIIVGGGFIIGLKIANLNAGTILLTGMGTQGRRLGELFIFEVAKVIKTEKLPQSALLETQQYIEANKRAVERVNKGMYKHLKITNKILMLPETKASYTTPQDEEEDL